MRKPRARPDLDAGGSAFLSPVKRVTIVDTVTEQLASMILDGGWLHGDRLPSERELMEMLRVSRSSLREALRSLSLVGLLETRQGEGTFVVKDPARLLHKPLHWGMLGSVQEVRALIETRRLVEVAAAGWAAERGTAAEIASLGHALHSMECSVTNRRQFADADVLFHMHLGAAAHNPFLKLLVDTIRAVLRETILKNLSTGADYAATVELHRLVVEAIRNRQPAAARLAMEHHMDDAALHLMAVLQYASDGTRGSEGEPEA